eukprot:gene37088-45018_t
MNIRNLDSRHSGGLSDASATRSLVNLYSQTQENALRLSQSGSRRPTPQFLPSQQYSESLSLGGVNPTNVTSVILTEKSRSQQQQTPSPDQNQFTPMDAVFRRLEKLEERSKQNEKLDRLLILLEGKQESQAKALDGVSWDVQELQRLLNANNTKLSFIAGSVENIENKKQLHAPSTLNLEIKLGDLEAQLRGVSTEVRAAAARQAEEKAGAAQRDGLDEVLSAVQERLPSLVDQQVHGLVYTSHSALQQKLLRLEREVQLMRLSSAQGAAGFAAEAAEGAGDWPLLPFLRQLVAQEVQQAREQLDAQLRRELDRELERRRLALQGAALPRLR